jgi:PTS system nitrogen regulatory IIA component
VVSLNVKHLPRDRILLGLRIKTELDLFTEVARSVAGSDPLMAARVRDRLALRHARRTVCLGGGVALPHAAIPGLTATRAVFVRSLTPIAMGSTDEEGVTSALALLVPPPGLAADYDLLMSLTDFLRRAATREALLRARSAAQVQALFVNEDPV